MRASEAIAASPKQTETDQHFQPSYVGIVGVSPVAVDMSKRTTKCAKNANRCQHWICQ